MRLLNFQLQPCLAGDSHRFDSSTLQAFILGPTVSHLIARELYLGAHGLPMLGHYS